MPQENITVDFLLTNETSSNQKDYISPSEPYQEVAQDNNFRFLINGKPASEFTDNCKDALKKGAIGSGLRSYAISSSQVDNDKGKRDPL